jgi:hypothetical protein
MVKSTLSQYGVSYKRLSRLLERLGEDASENAIAHRISRGSFSFVFFLKVAKAVGIEQLDLTFLARLSAPPPGSKPRAPHPLSRPAGFAAQSQFDFERSLGVTRAKMSAEVQELDPEGG